MPRRPKTQIANPLVPVVDAAVISRSAMVQIRIGSRTYPAVRDPRCPVCLHPGRVQIEEKLLFNETYKAIAEWAADVDHEDIDGTIVAWPVLSPAQLTRHFKSGHCPIDARVLHDLTEARNGEMATGYETMSGRVVDHVVTLQSVLSRGQERLVRGEIEPGVKETISAAKALAALEVAAAQTEQQDRSWFYESAMKIYFDEAQKIMNPEQWTRFSMALQTNPVLRQLTERAQQTEIVDAEVVS